MDGFVVIDKPVDRSSAFIARIVGKMLDAAKVGHLGTLDPFATGVLPIAVNGATKLIPYVKPVSKTYVFEIVFGEKRDTSDRTGNIIETSDVIPSPDDLLSVLPCFIGNIKQIPSSFSAIKIDGKRAYKIARAGKTVQMPTRNVTIFELKLIKQSSENSYVLEARVSPGTYIRSLAGDIAAKLGTVGYLQTLSRIADGKFRIEDAIKVENLEKESYNLSRFLRKPEDILDDIPVILIGDRDFENYLKDGRGMPVNSADCEGVFFLNKETGFLAIGRVTDNLAYTRKIVRLSYV